MKPEDLFAAIGTVESSRLEQSEKGFQQSSHANLVEDSTMYLKKTNHRRVLRSTLVAAFIITLLAATAFAASGFILFDSPRQMIEQLFGNHTGYDTADWSAPDYKGDVAAEFHSDRAEINDAAAETLAAFVEPVGQSITWAGHTLTVDANTYDAATKCGFVTYTIENPNGIRTYNVAPNGEIGFPFGELLTTNQYGRSYVIQEKCTDTTLCATYYYQTRNPQCSDLEMRICFWACMENPEDFSKLTDKEIMAFSDSPDAIVIPANTSSNVRTVTIEDGAITLSPFSVQVDFKQLANEENDYIENLTLTFRDGSEYTVFDGYTINYLFNVGDGKAENTMMLNRLVDLDTVASVTVNGITFENNA